MPHQHREIYSKGLADTTMEAGKSQTRMARGQGGDPLELAVVHESREVRRQNSFCTEPIFLSEGLQLS